jgi:predicted nucleic acid-binding protein
MTTSGAEPIGRLVLDTSAYARFRSGHHDTLELIAAAEIVMIPTVVLGELHAGFTLGSRTAENRVALAEFLSERFVEALDITTNTARLYGDIFARLRKAGTPIPTNDVWIAAATLDCGGRLVSFDTDFSRIDGLPLALLS